MNPWIVYSRRTSSAALRLFSFAHAGGGSAAFRGWHERLGDQIELGYVQLPGRESRLRETPYASIPELIPTLVDAIAPQMDRPFAFYGHSLGARIAFEAARELRRRGLAEPAHLFVAACHAPQIPWPHPPMHGLAMRPFLREVLKRYGGIPQQVLEDEELCALLAPALQADVTMIETVAYTPEPPLGCGISAFGGLRDAMVEKSTLQTWQTQTRGSFHLEMLPGDHFFPHVVQSRLPESIAAELLEVMSSHKPAAHGRPWSGL